MARPVKRLLSLSLALAGMIAGPAAALAAGNTFAPLTARFDRKAEADASLQDFLARFRDAIAKGDIAFVDSVLAQRFTVLTCDDSGLDACAPGKPAARTAAGVTPGERLRAGLGALPDASGADADDDVDPDEAADDPRMNADPPAAPGPAPAANSVSQGAAPAAPAAPAAAPTAAAPAPAATESADTQKPAAGPRTVEDVVIGQLSGMIDSTTLGTHPDLPGLACLPAWPLFDRAAAKKIATSASVDDGDLRIASNETPVRAAPKLEGEVLATLPVGTIVPIVNDRFGDVPPGWTALALPDGRVGWSDDLGLDELDPVGPCFTKENGAWKLALVILRDR